MGCDDCSYVNGNLFVCAPLTISEFEERAIILGILVSEEVDELVIPASFLDRANREKTQLHETVRSESEVIFEKGDEYRGSSETQLPMYSIPLIKFVTSSLPGIEKTWVFTKADPDPLPSVPHGHFKDKDNPEPKLDPYKGKAFKINGNEEEKYRLTKKEMVILWDSSDFQRFCKEKLKDFVEREPEWLRYLKKVEYDEFPRPWYWNKDLHEFWQKRRKGNHH